MPNRPIISKTRRKVNTAFAEVSANEPSIVAKTRRKKGAAAANRQKVAISLAKARAEGARIPRSKPKRYPRT